MKNFTGVKSLLLLTCCMGLKLFAQNPLQYQINQQGNGNCAGSPVELSVATAVRLSTTLAGSITANAAVSGGTVLNDGGKPVTQRGVCWNASPNPTIANFSSSDGNGLGNFNSSLSGLSPNTTYYARAYAINSAGTFYGNEISFTTINPSNPTDHSCGAEKIHNPNLTYGSMTDQEGNVYKTIVIGNQEWMAENLKTSIYRNGNAIPARSGSAWPTDSNPIGAYYDNNGASPSDCPYGKLYNWYAVSDPRGLCPTGWHVPTSEDWNNLIGYLDPNYLPNEYLGEQSLIAGEKLKNIGNDYWQVTQNIANNESGFSALPGGWCNAGELLGFGGGGFWWSSTSLCGSCTFAGLRRLGNSGSLSQNLGNRQKVSGFSVRCLKDDDNNQGFNINCNSPTNMGVLGLGVPASGVSSIITYDGSYGHTYNGQIVTSTGVQGLSAAWEGTIADGSGNITISISGTPLSSGTANFELNIQGKVCNLTRTVYETLGSISSLNCSSAQINGTLFVDSTESNLYCYLPYTGGNGGVYGAQKVTSTGVNGLMASLSAGNFFTGSGIIGLEITGTPLSSGTASFALNIGGQSCTLNLPVNVNTGIQTPANCGASNVHNPIKDYGILSDQQGNIYKTIVIGTQEWMAENLKTTIYRNGDAIANAIDGAQWFGLNTGAWCSYNNNSQFDCPYGKLYNWYAVADPRNVCPTGWHVPTDAEWTTLTNNLGGQGLAGGKMKSLGTQYWSNPNSSGTNESGFSGLPMGFRDSDINSTFKWQGANGIWWSSSENFLGSFAVFNRILAANSGNIERNITNKKGGLSVRCLRD